MVADSDEETRTSDEVAEVPALAQASPQRLVASLQIRDPERYDVLGEHGRGGLGKVARAHDKELGRHVAIKELIKRGDLGEVRFLREALITARLEHPGIVPIHEAGRWPDGTPFYVMKLVAGRSLRELLAERKTVGQRISLLHHVVAVADAIAYAHERKIIHRDLKPANVIVGDFGETVVIDWGLAKDLSQPEEPVAEAGPYRTAALTDLTETGAVLGTPTYMAPEQWRGEAVDQRADVFAIGAMLWEVCSTSQVPPTDPRHRDRLLRKAGIDQDLCTILVKALAPEPERRYRDASELAADLKAFTSGARIASRRYSLLGVIGHWTRRHRALSITIAVGVVFATIGAVVSVFNIASARERAESEQRRAETEQRRAEDANAELVLENAELLMTRDPTAVVTALADYRGANTLRKQRLLAEARGRGVAESVLNPHSDTVMFLAGDANGALFSLGTDRRIRVTQNGVSVTLASDVKESGMHCYSEQRRLLVYVTLRDAIALLDLKTRTTEMFETVKPYAMALSPDGTRLAVVNKDGLLVVWALTEKREVIYRASLPEVQWLLFSGADKLAVSSRGRLHSISLNGERDLAVAVPGAYLYDVHDGNVAMVEGSGGLLLFSPKLSLLAKAAPCHKGIIYAKFAGMPDAIAYACREGGVGLLQYDQASHSLLLNETFSTMGPVVQFNVDASGRWVLAATKFHTLYVYDARSKIVSRYEGQAARMRTVTAPTPVFNHIVTGDVNGAVRVWRLPSNDSNRIYQARHGLADVEVTPDGLEAVIGGFDGTVRRVNLADGRVVELLGHSGSIYKVGVATQGVYSSSADGTIRTWVGALTRAFSEHGSAAEAGYHSLLNRVVSVGSDGRMFAWPMTGHEMTLLFKHSAPLVALEVLSNSGRIVTSDRFGGVWSVAPEGAVVNVRKADGVPVTLLKASRSGRRLAIVTIDLVVVVYDTSSWLPILSMRVDGNVRQIDFDPEDRDLLIASEDGLLRAVSLGSRRLPWQEFPARVRDVIYHPSGDVIAFVCSGGSAWFYYVSKDAWVYAKDHDEDVLSAVFAHDGASFVSVDAVGAVVVRRLLRETR